jgi:hypothetical protein
MNSVIRDSFWFVALVVVAVSLVTIRVAAKDDANNQENQSASSATTTQTPTIKLQGSGRQSSDKFTLQPGLAVINTTHQGKSNYIVYLVNSDGEEVQSLFNSIGKYDATRGFEITKPGEYVLNVQADGIWTFAIEQPRPTTGESTPRTITGKKTEVSPFLNLKKGLAVFKYGYQGDSRFSVMLMNQNGRAIEQIVNTLKASNGSAPIKIEEDGLYFLNVNADTNWQIDVQ